MTIATASRLTGIPFSTIRLNVISGRLPAKASEALGVQIDVNDLLKFCRYRANHTVHGRRVLMLPMDVIEANLEQFE